MKLGDFVHAILHPFVAGTSLEHCSGCEERRKKWNGWSDAFVRLMAKISCPCFYKGLWYGMKHKKQ